MEGPVDPITEQLPTHLQPPEVERVAREFTLAYHDLKDQTFATTTWLGVPLVKTATDILAFQQIIAATKPELIVETGVYVGGSALLFASIQELMGIDGGVVAVDVDLGAVHERVREHPRIELIEGSSLDDEIVGRIRKRAEGKRVMVDLDADHRAHHVLAELRAYAELVTPGCYLVVEDGFLGGRPVRPEAVPGPSEALEAWWAEEQPFVVDRWHERFLMTQNPRGYMRRLGPGGEDVEPPRPARPDRFLIGALERSEGAPSTSPPAPESALAELEAAAGESDREVEALRRGMAGMDGVGRGGEIAAREPIAVPFGEASATPAGTQGGAVEKLLNEISVQQELLRERGRLLAREQARLRRIEESLPFRIYRGLRRVPGLRTLFELRDRRRLGKARARNARRAHARRNRTERFIDHHRGQ
jgi:cephalosporin hydroxylase